MDIYYSLINILLMKLEEIRENHQNDGLFVKEDMEEMKGTYSG